jgi:hypothetical protein
MTASWGRAFLRLATPSATNYVVEPIGPTARILPYAIVEKCETSSSGALVTPTENSTKPVTTLVTHPGIGIVDQFADALRRLARNCRR